MLQGFEMALIAVVDDSRLARTFTGTCLRKAGHEVVDIDPLSIFEVLKVLRENAVHLLVMDYLMPGCPGASLVRVIREDPDLKELPILVITAHRDEEIQDRLQRMGTLGFLHKPFDPQSLLDAVAPLLAPSA